MYWKFLCYFDWNVSVVRAYDNSVTVRCTGTSPYIVFIVFYKLNLCLEIIFVAKRLVWGLGIKLIYHKCPSLRHCVLLFFKFCGKCDLWTYLYIIWNIAFRFVDIEHGRLDANKDRWLCSTNPNRNASWPMKSIQVFFDLNERQEILSKDMCCALGVNNSQCTVVYFIFLWLYSGKFYYRGEC